jgi:hypothetical protein
MSKFFQKPIIVTVPMTQSYWATLRAQGVLPTTIGKPLWMKYITWNDPGPNAQFVITDSFGNELKSGNTPADYVGADINVPVDEQWRDWQVTVLTGGDLYLHAR